MTQPYTYLITQKSTGIRYYGVKFAKNCNPSDLGITYFSSSKVLNKLILEQGKENFTFEVRKLFNDKIKAINWEIRFLTRIKAAQSPLWFNKSNGGSSRFFRKIGYKCSEETKQKMRKPKSPEHRKKLKEILDKLLHIDNSTKLTSRRCCVFEIPEFSAAILN